MSCRITNSPIADVMIVWAKSSTDDRIHGFILEKGIKGLTCPVIEGKMSLRAGLTGQIVMEDVEIPEDNLLPNVSGLGVSVFRPIKLCTHCITFEVTTVFSRTVKFYTQCFI